MKKLVPETLDESVITNLKSFLTYGPSMSDQKNKSKIMDFIHQISYNNEEVHLFDDGLKIGNIEINTKRNIISLDGSEVFLTKKEVLELYNEILKKSFGQ
jgi:hypothetical protein